ncbi:MAG: ABC transporter permease [Coriobacteriia bacterium]|nr:ABC transporter permease [Coriobacteriia bacterium]
MRATDLSHETVSSLRSNKARSLLTILGIVIGIVSVIVMISIGDATKASITGELSSVGSNLLMVTPQYDALGAQDLEVADAEAIRTVPGVAAVSPTVTGQYTVIADSNSINVSVIGATEAYATVKSIQTASGAWFTSDEVARGSKMAVLGSAAAEDLFGDGSNPVGQRVRIGGTQFTVGGVAESKGSSGMQNPDDSVYVTLGAASRYLSGSDALTMIDVQADGQEQMDAAQNSITNLLMSRHDINDTADADFQVSSMAELAATVDTITSLLTVVLGSIAGISLVVGGIGIMNMMLTNVTERIREIGLRKAIGATRTDITSQFLAEAVALTMVGGLIGIALGWAIAALVSAVSTFEMGLSIGSVALAFGVSTAIGLVFGYYPARRAAKMDPIDALRYQ